MRRALRWVGVAFLILLGLLTIYEGYAVWRAKQRTPAVLAEAAGGPLKLSDIPPRRIAMLVKVDDPNFYHHRGVECSAKGTGLTTITQALVKRFYFKHFHKGFPKIEQTLIARFVLDPAMPKDRQLQAFFNFANFGTVNHQPVTGFDAASQSFFQRPLSAISDRQYLSLVAMLNAPNLTDPIRHPKANAERVARIEALLAGKCEATSLTDIDFEACARFAR